MSTQAGGAPKKKSGMMIGCAIAAGVGFCLILPVTGILAAIAIPNFIKFQCKSQQSEAKMNLRGLKIAEEAFREEHGFYTSDLTALNWEPDGSPRYVYGFVDAGPGNLKRSDVKPDDYDETRQDTADLDAGHRHFSAAKMIDTNHMELSRDDLPDSRVKRDSFVAGAAGDLTKDSSRRLDQWTIDEKGNVAHVENDCGGSSSREESGD
jgi:type II secretory pathway pseudopilin PulG